MVTVLHKGEQAGKHDDCPPFSSIFNRLQRLEYSVSYWGVFFVASPQVRVTHNDRRYNRSFLATRFNLPHTSRRQNQWTLAVKN